MFHCESAKLHIRARGKDIVVPLSDTQIIIAGTILGVHVGDNGDVSAFPDDTLRRFGLMRNNPLLFAEQTSKPHSKQD